MSQLLDAVAIAIVLFCAVYAMRALLPRALLERVGGKKVAANKNSNCGDCGGCATDKKSDKNNNDDGCH